jgi:hypothetical protein
MDFNRQCRRFVNYRVFNDQQFKTNILNISAIASFKVSNKPQSTAHGASKNPTYNLVVADNSARKIHVLSEANGTVLRTVAHNWDVYGICCTNQVGNNCIYVSDYANNCIHKLDEGLNKLSTLMAPSDCPLNGPCGIAINHELERVDVVDQKNHRVVSFSLKTDEYLSDLPLYKDFFEKIHKTNRPLIEIILSQAQEKKKDNDGNKHSSRELINCWPFGIATKNERVYVVDWSEGHIYVYKNNQLELKIGGPHSFTRIRDILIDNMDNILVTDIYRKSIFVFDNKGILTMETKLPIISDDENETIYGMCKIDNSRLIFATSSSIVICNIGP